MKSVLLIGLGRFGRHMAMKFQELHHEVLAIDSDEQRVNDALDLVTNAQIGDSTNEQFIASLGVRNFSLRVQRFLAGVRDCTLLGQKRYQTQRDPGNGSRFFRLYNI